MFLVFFCIFGVYLHSLVSGVHWKDSAEFITMGYRLSITHPPGHSTACLLMNACHVLPLGPFPFRVNMLSGASIALAACLFYDSVARLLKREVGLGSGSARLAALPCAFVPCLGMDLWQTATSAEAYGPLLLLWGLACTVAVKHGKRAEGAFFLLGLATGCHLKTLIFLPCLAPALIHLLRDWRRRGPIVIRAASLFAAGAAVILYMPIRSDRSPFVDWDATSTLSGFLHHVTTRQFRYALKIPSWPDLAWGLAGFAESLWDTLTPILLPFAIVGMVLLWVKRPRWGLGLSALFAIEMAYGLFVNPMGIEYREAGHMVYFVAAGCVSVCASSLLLTLRARFTRRTAIGLLLLMPCWMLARNTIFASRRYSASASDLSLHLARRMDRRCLAVLSAGTRGFQFWVLQEVEGRMERSLILCREGLKWHGQVGHLEREWGIPFSQIISGWTRDPATAPKTSWDRWLACQVADITMKLDQRPAYWEIDGQESGDLLAGQFASDKLMARIIGFKVSDPLVGKAYRDLWTWWDEDEAALLRHYCDEHAVREICAIHNAYGILLANAGQLKAAQEAFARALEITPRRGTAVALCKTQMNMGILLSLMGRQDEAEIEMRRAQKTYAGSPDVLYWLGEFARLKGDLDGARRLWRVGLHLAPSHPGCLQRLDETGKG